MHCEKPIDSFLFALNADIVSVAANSKTIHIFFIPSSADVWLSLFLIKSYDFIVQFFSSLFTVFWISVSLSYGTETTCNAKRLGRTPLTAVLCFFPCYKIIPDQCGKYNCTFYDLLKIRRNSHKI